ncbi:Methyltransferase type 11 [Methanococcus vannielii SB]|uniref:Methyltransferase type 11 n=1 Tax=Methanococcus vannielii (strain ATCC 35089 / DSM 1224 / JCM 13029 / OCM 148 / SB) TaxID=406327 RepID=A6UQH6_METVS|nr:class I SAM-dependent methyltransferase [Methanococcus vannielii]ABR54748.1 Methyltransferase type 11 [Methanococcus vannielii SB]
MTNSKKSADVLEFYENWDFSKYPDYLTLLMDFEENLIYDIISKDEFFKSLKLETDFSKVLDAGCGFGSFYNLTKDFDTIYMDFSKNLLKKFKSKKNKICADIEKMPFNDSVFNLVLCINVLEHVNFLNAILEVKRVLKPNGRAYFVVVNKNSIINDEIFIDWKIPHELISVNDFKALESFDFQLESIRSFYFLPPLFKIFPKSILKKIIDLFFKNDEKISKYLKFKGQFLICKMVKK